MRAEWWEKTTVVKRAVSISRKFPLCGDPLIVTVASAFGWQSVTYKSLVTQWKHDPYHCSWDGNKRRQLYLGWHIWTFSSKGGGQGVSPQELSELHKAGICFIEAQWRCDISPLFCGGFAPSINSESCQLAKFFFSGLLVVISLWVFHLPNVREWLKKKIQPHLWKTVSNAVRRYMMPHPKENIYTPETVTLPGIAIVKVDRNVQLCVFLIARRRCRAWCQTALHK